MFRSVRRLWRLVFGLSFFCAGITYLEVTPISAWVTIAIGAAMIIWHIVHTIRKSKRN